MFACVSLTYYVEKVIQQIVRWYEEKSLVHSPSTTQIKSGSLYTPQTLEQIKARDKLSVACNISNDSCIIFRVDVMGFVVLIIRM